MGASLLANLKGSSGVNINNEITSVITDINKLNELDINIFTISTLTFARGVFFFVIKPSAL